MIHRPSHKRRAGFSLLEFAIVLAIAGLVLGGLWTLVGKSKEVVSMQQATGQLIVLNKNIRGYYLARRGCVNAAANADLTPALTAVANDPPVIPRDMLVGTTIISPWSTNILVRATAAGDAACAGAGAYQYDLVYAGMPTAACVDFVVRATAPGEVSRGLNGVQINGVAVTNMPPNPSVLAGAGFCAAAATADVRLTYRLRVGE